MKNVKILVIMYKPYTVPEDKQLYLPIQTGSAIWEDLGVQRDDSGDNISEKNVKYNELCAIYWAWKNLKADYIGACHYRRLFSDSKRNGTTYAEILKRETIEKLLDQNSIILPPMKNYHFLSLKQHYIHSLAGYEKIHEKDLMYLEEAISAVAPEYIDSYHKVMNGSKAHMLNISIMSREKFNEYCEFIFPILFKVEELLTDRDNRFIGALSEFLMDVWIKKNNYEYTELGLVELEHENFIEKLYHFLKDSLIKRGKTSIL